MHLSLATGFSVIFVFFLFTLRKTLAEVPPPDTPLFEERFVVSFFQD